MVRLRALLLQERDLLDVDGIVDYALLLHHSHAKLMVFFDIFQHSVVVVVEPLLYNDGLSCKIKTRN